MPRAGLCELPRDRQRACRSLARQLHGGNVNFSGTSDLFRCWFEAADGSSGPIALTTSRVGPNIDVSPHSGQATLTLSGPETVRVACSHDNNIAGGVGLLANTYMEGGVLTFLKVAP